MRVLITGGRDFDDVQTLDKLHSEHSFTVLIHGDASGADRLAGMWAESKGIAVEAYPADWKKFGRAAGPIRNQMMLAEKPELLVAFPGGNGTAARAKKAGLNVVVVDS